MSSNTELAGCSPPSSPLNGYINPYTSTVEGAQVTFTCQNTSQNGIETPPEELHSAICTTFGIWEPDPFEFCSGINMAILSYSKIIIHMAVKFYRVRRKESNRCQ